MNVTVRDTSEATTILPGPSSHLDNSMGTGSSDLQQRTHALANLLVTLTEGNALKLTPGVVSSRIKNEMRRFVVRRGFTNFKTLSYVKLEDEVTGDIYELQSGRINTKYATITLFSRSTQNYIDFYGYRLVETTR